MPKNNLISQFLILNLAFLTNFPIEKIGQCETIHLAYQHGPQTNLTMLLPR
jgi:hypothetical protein